MIMHAYEDHNCCYTDTLTDAVTISIPKHPCKNKRPIQWKAVKNANACWVQYVR